MKKNAIQNNNNNIIYNNSGKRLTKFLNQNTREGHKEKDQKR